MGRRSAGQLSGASQKGQKSHEFQMTPHESACSIPPSTLSKKVSKSLLLGVELFTRHEVQCRKAKSLTPGHKTGKAYKGRL
jgi:hypothetical protein